MPQSLYVSLLIFCASFARGCYLDSEKWARCSSFEELAGDGPQNWRSVYLSGNTKQEHVTIPAGAFGNLTDVHNILISRMLKDIDPGTFKDIKKLDWLKMGDNTLHKLRAGSFSSPTLEVLTVENSQVWDLEEDLLRDMPNIEQFWLTGNNIPFIRSGTFKNDHLLQFSLADNNIQFIETDAFESLPQLNYLLLHSNRLTTVSRDMFKGMPKVQSLLLHMNVIDSIEDKAFVDLKEMTNLDISNNRLREIPASLFQDSWSKLYWFFIHNNALTYLSPELLNRLGDLGKISMAGNPWQCQCLAKMERRLQEKGTDNICGQDVRSGSRPSCIRPEGHAKCTYDSTYRNELIRLYQKVIRDYPQLPPICQTRARDEPKLEAVNQ